MRLRRLFCLSPDTGALVVRHKFKADDRLAVNAAVSQAARLIRDAVKAAVMRVNQYDDAEA